jgi:glycosyltransferase involved in cell wall biosynthesis
MAFVDVVDITRGSLDQEAVIGGHIDLPKVGVTVEGRGVEVAGWVIGRRSPAVAVEVASGRQVIARTRLNALRPDLEDAFPHVEHAAQGGFRVEASMPAAGTADLDIRGVLEDDTRVSLGVLSLRRRWRESSQPALRGIVSVVIPCFNQAHFLPEAIESVLGQTYADVEIVVVDDGSTDNTAAVVARYPTVRYVRQENAGAAAARNTGLRLTNGDLLTFLDADDFLSRDALAVGVRALEDHPEVAFVFGYATFLMEDGTEPSVPYRPTFTDDYYARLLAGCPIGAPGSVMCRRSVFSVVGPFDRDLRHLEDYDFYYRVAREYPIHCHGDTVVTYRRHGTNATSSGGRAALRDAMIVVGRQREFARRDPTLWKAYLDGRRYWAGHLGLQLVRDAQADLARGRWNPAARDVSTLLRWSPRDVLTLMRSPRRLSAMPEWTPES